MKTLITAESAQYVTESTLKGNEYIAYRSKSNSVKVTYCVMSKFKRDKVTNLPTAWCFICIGALDSPARFVASSWSECLRLAAKHRDIRVFDTQEEMLKAMANQTF